MYNGFYRYYLINVKVYVPRGRPVVDTMFFTEFINFSFFFSNTNVFCRAINRSFKVFFTFIRRYNCTINFILFFIFQKSTFQSRHFFLFLLVLLPLKSSRFKIVRSLFNSINKNNLIIPSSIIDLFIKFNFTYHIIDILINQMS